MSNEKNSEEERDRPWRDVGHELIAFHPVAGGKTLTLNASPGEREVKDIVLSYESIRATHYDGHFGANLILDGLVVELLGSDMCRLHEDLQHRRVKYIGANWTDALGIPTGAASVMSIELQTEHVLLEDAADAIPVGSILN